MSALRLLAALAPALLALAPPASAALVEVAAEVDAPLLPPVTVGASTEGATLPRVTVGVADAPVVTVGDTPEASASAPPTAGTARPEARALAPAAVAAGVGVTALLELVAGALMPLYSRIRRAAVLDNPVRARLFAHVQDHPGTSLTDLARALGLGWGTLLHHLGTLEREGFVTVEQGRGARLVFARGAVPREERQRAAATRGTAGRIAAFVAEHPGACQSDIAAALGLQAPAASKHLSRLVAEGVVRAVREWRSVCYFPAPQPVATAA